MKKKIIWWVQLIINCLFFLVLLFKLASWLVLSYFLSIIVGVVIIVLAPILGYALTVGFENDEH